MTHFFLNLSKVFNIVSINFIIFFLLLFNHLITGNINSKKYRLFCLSSHHFYRLELWKYETYMDNPRGGQRQVLKRPAIFFLLTTYDFAKNRKKRGTRSEGRLFGKLSKKFLLKKPKPRYNEEKNHDKFMIFYSIKCY